MAINEILGKNINSVKALREAIKGLQDSLVGLDAESTEFKTTAAQLAAAQAELTKVTKAGAQENTAATDSIRGMEQEYKKLYDTYKMLTEEQRNSDFGKNMAASLESLSTKLNESKKEVGNFKDNIGRYAESATEAFNGMGISIGSLQSPLKMAANGSKTLGTALKTLAANPIVLVITALVAILGKAVEAIKKNEELTMRLHQAMAAFQPVLDLISNAFDALAGIIVKAVEGFSKFAEKIMSLNPKMKEQIKSHKELAKATDELTKKTREANVENSKKEAEIERLREEASETQNLQEKKEKLEEAKRLQAEVDQKNIELAQEELRIQEEYAAKTANSAEENEKLAAAQEKVNQAIAAGEKNARMYNKQLNSLTNNTNSAASSGKNWRDEAKKLYEATLEYNKSELQKLTEKYEEEKKLLEKYHYDTTLLTKKYEKEKTDIELAEYRKRAEQRKTAEDNYYAGQARFYDNLVATDGAVSAQKEKTIQALLELIDFEDEAYKALDKIVDGELGAIPRKLYEIFLKYGDFMKNADVNFAESLIENFDFKGDNKLKAEVMATFKGLGEEGWASLWEGFQSMANELSKMGVNVKNLLDFEPIKKQLLGQLSNLRIDKAVQDNLIEQLNGLIRTVSNDTQEGYTKYVEEMERKALEVEKTALESELNNFKGTFDQKLELMQRYYDVVMQLRQKDWEDAKAKDAAMEALTNLQKERTAQMVESLTDMSDRIAGAMNTYRSSQEALIESQVKNGQIDEREAKKKKKRLLDLQRAERDFSIAVILADAASGIFSIWKGWADETGKINPQAAAAAGALAPERLAWLNAKSTISAVAKTTSLAAQAAAQVSAARSGYLTAKNNFEAENGDTGGGGVAASPVLIDSTPYSYTRTVQTQEDEDMLNQPIYVTVTDIEEGLGHRATVVGEASF